MVDDGGGRHADGALRRDGRHPPGPPVLQFWRQEQVGGQLMQSGGSPLLPIPLLLTPPPPAEQRQPAASKVATVYVGIGVLLGFDSLMYAYALLYLPVSTFSLVAATQLAFNAITSRLINAQRFTALIANSVVVLTFAAALLGIGSSSDETSSDVPRGKYALGFVLTLAASASFAVILSLFEVAFEKVIRARTMRWVLKVQMFTNLVATAVGVVGLFASGEWWTLPGEMVAFKNGRARYVLTLVGTAVCWQATAVGTVRLIARMMGIKAVAMLMAIWGFLSYVYQHYLDGRRAASGKGTECCVVCAARTAGDTT
ncbi:unnamed protein product [Miscanthus lutarioriparius]|uniref:Probable purine permease n=1 Tax=Miscanthus lutarioriparius TaxID=422564 RepID=A0A811R1Y6_9POAL|nr:unnamed protein product [Miscanthus lutarioriparius]